MSADKTSTIFDKTLQHSWSWIDDLIEDLELTDARSAYRVLRAAFHTLRDRLTVDEAVNLGAQLPMLLRGLYYEGWKPAATPLKLRTRQSFFERLARELVEERDPDPEEAARAVFDLIAQHISGGEVEQIRGMMPAELKDLWLPEIPSSEPSSPSSTVERVPPEILRAIRDKAPSAEKPTVEQIGLQHTQLHELINAIEDLLRGAGEEPGAETRGGTTVRASKRDLPTLMSDLRDGLAEHFSLEESAGFVAQAISEAPHLSRRAAAFSKQHDALLARASGLADEAAESLLADGTAESGLVDGTAASTDSASRWTALRSDFREFADEFRTHEFEENTLLQDAYLRDEGQGD